jgi:NhaP-type Na+/H+ or K+/H+ antiporter
MYMVWYCLPVQLAAHTLLFAGVNVVVSTLAFIPVMLYGLNLKAAGWGTMDAALFGAMLGSTDAVAVAAILKAGGCGCGCGVKT